MSTATWRTRRILLIDPGRRLPTALLADLRAQPLCELIEAEAGAVISADVALVVPPSTDLGTRLVRTVQAEYPALHVIVYDAMPSLDRYSNAFVAGVHGYSIAGVTGEELLAIIDVVRLGGFANCQRSWALTHSSITAPQDFSEREKLMLVLLTNSSTNAAIAEELGCSVRTVESSVKQLMSKVGASSRVGLALWWTRWLHDFQHT